MSSAKLDITPLFTEPRIQVLHLRDSEASWWYLQDHLDLDPVHQPAGHEAAPAPQINLGTSAEAGATPTPRVTLGTSAEVGAAPAPQINPGTSAEVRAVPAHQMVKIGRKDAVGAAPAPEVAPLLPEGDHKTSKTTPNAIGLMEI